MVRVDARAPTCKWCGTDSKVFRCRACGELTCPDCCVFSTPEGECWHMQFVMKVGKEWRID